MTGLTSIGDKLAAAMRRSIPLVDRGEPAMSNRRSAASLAMDTVPPWEFAARAARAGGDALDPLAVSLAHHGFVVIRSFEDEDAMRALEQDVAVLHQQLGPLAATDDPGALGERIYIRNDKTRALPENRRTGYRDIIAQDATVANFRGGATDAGMIDLFRPELYLERHERLFSNAGRDQLVDELSSRAFAKPSKPVVANLYINEGISRTRGYHVDGWGFKLKAFVYVTDVAETGAGPYCYARGTHRLARLKAYNRSYNWLMKQNNAEYQLFHASRETVLAGAKGDLIISVQNGAHRGAPQLAKAKRYMLVQMYS